MLSPPAGFTAAIALGELKLVELYEVVLLSGKEYYYTSHDEDIVWGDAAKRYISIPITRETISSQVNLQAQQVTIVLAGITSDLTTFIQSNALTGAQITIKRILYDQAWDSGLEIIFTEGSVPADGEVVTATYEFYFFTIKFNRDSTYK